LNLYETGSHCHLQNPASIPYRKEEEKKKRKTARSRDHEEQQIKRLDLSSTPLKIQARNNILQIHTPSFDNPHALPFPCTTPSRPFFFFFFPLTPQSCNLVA